MWAKVDGRDDQIGDLHLEIVPTGQAVGSADQQDSVVLQDHVLLRLILILLLPLLLGFHCIVCYGIVWPMPRNNVEIPFSQLNRSTDLSFVSVVSVFSVLFVLGTKKAYNFNSMGMIDNGCPV